MKNKSRKTGQFIGEVLIGLLFLFAVVGLFLWSVNRIVSSIEYKKSADVRTVTARVIDYDIKNSDDEYDDYDEYVAKLSYEVNGIKYTGKRIYYREVSIGEEKNVEVYLTPRGKYKMKGDDDPLTFLLACIGIPAGLLLTFIGGKVLVQIIVGHFKRVQTKKESNKSQLRDNILSRNRPLVPQNFLKRYISNGLNSRRCHSARFHCTVPFI